MLLRRSALFLGMIVLLQIIRVFSNYFGQVIGWTTSSSSKMDASWKLARMHELMPDADAHALTHHERILYRRGMPSFQSPEKNVDPFQRFEIRSHSITTPAQAGESTT